MSQSLSLAVRPHSALLAQLIGQHDPDPALCRQVHDEAVQALADMRRSMRPGTPAEMGAWLTRLCKFVANPPASETDFRDAVAVIAEVCADLPQGVWVRETRVSWLQKGPDASGRIPGKFWPYSAELYAHLSGYAAAMEAQCQAIERVIQQPALAAYATARRNWAAGGHDGPAPKREDFIPEARDVRVSR
ncbi:hypothetical protein [Gluconobacter potus]|uniref:hypothetical protein n=1 Tax=Gluconobacter potus TaxID=2724927 RepID=UPI0039E7374F